MLVNHYLTLHMSLVGNEVKICASSKLQITTWSWYPGFLQKVEITNVKSMNDKGTLYLKAFK